MYFNRPHASRFDPLRQIGAGLDVIEREIDDTEPRGRSDSKGDQ
jgi:hypothetical protein